MATLDDYTADSNSTGVLRPGGETSGIFEQYQDADWFRISLSSDTFYTVDLSAPALVGAYYNLEMSLKSALGASLAGMVASSTSGGMTASIKVAVAGDYFINVLNYASQNKTAFGYTLKASAGVKDDVGDTLQAAQPLALGALTSRAFEGISDVDVYRTALQAGVTYTFKQSWLKGGSSTYALSTKVADANGQAVTLYGSNDSYSFTAATSGDYYLTASGSSSGGTASGYTLLLAPSADDFGANPAGAGRLAVGGSSAGRLEAGADKDWYAVSLTAGNVYWFSVKPDSSGGNSAYGASGALLKLFDGAERVVASATGQGSQSLLEYIPTKSGTYYFELSDSSSYNSGGSYLVSAAIGVRDDFGDDRASAAAITVGIPLKGKLETAGDADVFKFTVKEGKTYLIEMTAQDSQGSPNLFLSAQDANGYSTSMNSYLKAGAVQYGVYTAKYSGDFYLTADNSYSYGTSGYTLSVKEPLKDDYAGSSASTAVLQAGGKVGGMLDYTGDNDWFKISLVAGNKYAFVLDGTGGGGTLDTSVGAIGLGLSGPGGASTYMNSMAGLAGKGYVYSCSVTGDYYLSAGPGGYGSASPLPLTGSYTVSAFNVSSDISMPVVSAFSPASGSSGASPTANITLTFDGAVRAGDSYIRLIDPLGNVVESFSASNYMSRMQIVGNVLTIDPLTNLRPGSKYTLEIPAGALLDYAGNKFLADTVYSFTTVDTVAQGGSGNDYLSGIGVNARLSGGEGIDTVLYAGTYAIHTVSRGAVETRVLYNNGSGNPGAGDILTGVERLQFGDRSIALDVDGHGGQAYRLYQAAFNRAPDKAGLGYWMAQLDQGASLGTAAEAFLGSSEFLAGLGAGASDTAFVNHMYKNVLHRDVDAGGAAYWLGVLSSGVSRADLMISFSESAENQAEAIKFIGNGFEYTPYG